MVVLLKRILTFTLLLLLLAVNVSASPNVQVVPTHRPVRYTPITYASIQGNRGLETWYRRYYQTKGIFFRRYRGRTYVLISAGQRPTGGYRVVLRDVRRISRGTVFITASVIRPPRNVIVTQVITYPHILIRIEDPRITRVEGTIGEFRNEGESEETLQEETLQEETLQEETSDVIFESAS